METMEITGIKHIPVSKVSGKPTKFVTFRSLKGGSAVSWIDSSLNNYQNWAEVFKAGVGTIVTNLEMKKDRERTVDADSKPIIVESNEAKEKKEADCGKAKEEARANLQQVLSDKGL